MRRDLKADLKKLFLFAKKLKVAVWRRRADFIAKKRKGAIDYYSPSERKIYLSTSITDIEKLICVFAHELGHVIYFDRRKKDKTLLDILAVVGCFVKCVEEKRKVPRALKKFVLDLERIAFDEAEKIISLFSISVTLGVQRQLRTKSLRAVAKSISDFNRRLR